MPGKDETYIYIYIKKGGRELLNKGMVSLKGGVKKEFFFPPLSDKEWQVRGRKRQTGEGPQ